MKIAEYVNGQLIMREETAEEISYRQKIDEEQRCAAEEAENVKTAEERIAELEAALDALLSGRTV